MRLSAMLLLATCACTAFASDVGIFDGTRLLDPSWSPKSGFLMTTFGAVWESRGATWRETPVLTSSFLSTVSVFYTSEINAAEFTADEQTAALSWVQAGGTLIVTCDCPCDGNQVAYNTLLNLFGVNDLGSGSPGHGAVVGAHRVTSGIASPNFGVHGVISGPAGAPSLINDVNGKLTALVLQGTPEVGNGRLLVVADNDCFSEFGINGYEDNLMLAANMADWALRPYTISGAATLDGAVGSPTGLPIQLQLFDQTGLLETFSGTLDSSGHYSVAVDYSGSLDVWVKPHKWLSVRKQGVSVGTTGTVDIEFPYGGDADDSNSVKLLDLSLVLLNYGLTGNNDADVNLSGSVGISDLSLVLLNYNMAGDK